MELQAYALNNMRVRHPLNLVGVSRCTACIMQYRMRDLVEGHSVYCLDHVISAEILWGYLGVLLGSCNIR